jgi:hypothetical protein
MADGPKIDFSGAERRDRFDVMQVFALGQPQPRELALTQPLPQVVGLDVGIGVERDEPFAFVSSGIEATAGAVIVDETPGSALQPSRAAPSPRQSC